MKQLFIFFILSCFILSTYAQSQGKVVDAKSGEPLPGASIILFSSGKKSGLVTNKDGIFSIANIALYDSGKVSVVGYRSRIIYSNQFINGNLFEITLENVPAELSEVIIKRTTALDIIRKVITAISSWQPSENFESKGFYREIIKDRENYFSVAEAVFLVQYFPGKDACKLKLLQGRSKEDVSYTRLFEDFHPGGGPQSASDKSFLIARPDFLNEKKIKYFYYKIDSLVKFDDHWLYSISFDQKAGIKQALEKGRLLIDADDFYVVRYESENSPLGIPYIKDLTGSDKIIAGLLNIDFDRKGWKQRVDFAKLDDKWMLSYVESERKIGYKQPKKRIDLDLTINIELLMTELLSPVTREITKDEEWKRKNIVANLPSAFDPAFWGGNNIISPTQQIKNIVESISKNNHESSPGDTVSDWQYLNRNFFVSFHKADTITIIPIMKCWWEDEQQGGMLYKEMEGDFMLETKISITKNKVVTEMPDKGFQQAGIIIRNPEMQKENYIFLGIGTGGNPVPKIVFKKTTESHSKTFTEKNADMNAWLRLERRKNKIIAWYKNADKDDWKKIGEYELNWLSSKNQFGLGVYAGFPGSAPKMQPDLKAEFFQTKVDKL